MSRLHHLGRFTLDSLAAEAKDGYSLSYIVFFIFLTKESIQTHLLRPFILLA